MTGSENVSTNPFVGPRPFEPGEPLYGRDREIRKLDNLLGAERVVLLYSPSGAGKSSLVQAGLMPQLKGSFDVWGPTRVNQEPPAGVDGNRYALSTMAGLEEEVPAKRRRPPEVLAGQTLHDYLQGRPRRRSAPPGILLIFDQFEEVLTVDPLAVEAKREFFDQLGELLRNPQVWALFVLREDYLAPLDPYAQKVPTHFKNRFRIDLLGLHGAREAMVNPARRGGREFPAAEQLVHDLATMMVQRADGSFVRQTGRHVEPVQLQVVCRRLWDAMPEDDLSIDPEDLAQSGDVTQALGGYYADSVARIAAGDAAHERTVREWFDYQLITAGGIRGQVLKGAEESEGLANETIARILDTHLVRAETRGGAIWYELAHDRLIEPVRTNNAAWRDAHLSEVQQRATLWDQQARPIGMLLAPEEMAAAERWAAGAAVTTAVEKDFLDASRRARAAVEQERRQTRRIKRLAIAATIVSVLALFALGIAGWQWWEADTQKQIAQEQSRIASEESDRAKREKEAADQARSDAVEHQRLAEQQEGEAKAARQDAEDQRAEAESQRRTAVAQKAIAEENEQKAQRQKEEADAAKERALEEEERAKEEKDKAEAAREEAARLRLLAEVEALAVRTTDMTEEAHHQLAALLALQAYRVHLKAGGEAENPHIYDAMRLALRQLGAERRRIVRHAEVRSLAVSPDGRTLAFGDDDGDVHLVDVERLDGEIRSAARFGDGVSALAWSAGGRLAAGSFDGALQVLDPGEPAAEPRVLNAAGAAASNSLAFQPDGDRLAAGDEDGQVRLWDLDAADAAVTVLPLGDVDGNDADVRAVAWSPDGVALAAAVYGRGVLIWDAAAAEEQPRLLAAEPGVRSLAFSNDGSRLAAGTARGPILVWQPPEAGAEPVRLPGHTGRVEAVRFHPRLSLLASGSADRSLRLWDVQRPEAQPIVLDGHERWVWTVAFSPDGEHLFSGSSDRTVRLWTTVSEALAQEICETVERNLTPREWNEYLPGEVEYELTCAGLPATATEPAGDSRGG